MFPSAFRAILLASLWLGLFLPACTSQPRTEHTANQLAGSTSPYLLQHAHNPVDWYPWGEEALAKAQAEDKLIIVSVGYAACHWCHVMERESFEDTAVAKLMNEHFVSIKVDREQRPDVDQIYMNAAYLSSGRGGWPLNAIALPDGRPIFAATYFPQAEWIRLLEHFIRTRSEQPAELERAATQILQGIKTMDSGTLNPEPAAFAEADAEQAYRSIAAKWDFAQGGLQGPPKFPMPAVQRYLLRYHYYTGADSALQAVTTTLDAMARGGIYDQLGGGFARYAVDAAWKVPHFEKMLYDNAQLASLYTEAWQLTGNPAYRQVVYETLGFVARELTDSLGGFYSSLDADSEGMEGAYYVWTEKDITKTAGHDALAFKTYFNVSPFGNWEGEAKTNILYRTESLESVGQRLGYEPARLARIVEHVKGQLLEKRLKRERPGLDDKVLASWNGLMLKAYAEAYRAFGDSSFLVAAQRNAHFVTRALRRPDGGLYRNWKGGQAEINGFADDYAFVIEGLLALYQATFEERWLFTADSLIQYTLAHFQDEASGMFYYTSDIDDPLITRSREVTDNVIPASNSVLALDLFYLGTYLYQPAYLDRAQQMLNNVIVNVQEDGPYFAQWATLLMHQVWPPFEVAIVGADWDARRRELAAYYHPDVLLLGGATEGRLELLQRRLVPGLTRLYVCQDKFCKLPVESVPAARQQLER